MNIPQKCHDLIRELTNGGWSFVVQHGKDTGEHPFISIEARRETAHLMVTWHTRATGTYRLFACMVNKHDTTLTKAMEAVGVSGSDCCEDLKCTACLDCDGHCDEVHKGPSA